MNACRELGIELNVWSTHDVEEKKKRKECIKSLANANADVILLHPSNAEHWDEIAERLNKEVPVVSFGHNSSFWSLSNVPLEAAATINAYHLYGGAENIKNMLRYIGKEVLSQDYKYENPVETMWQGIYHPDAETAFESIEDYFTWYKPSRKHKVGILFSRTYWVNRNLKIVNAVIRELEKNEFDVIPVFCYGMGDKELGAKSSGEIVESLFTNRTEIDALINLQSVFHGGSSEGSSVNALKKLDVPVFHPLTAIRRTEEEWRADDQGLSSLEVGWSVAMPELEGVIEPIIVGVVSRSDGDDDGDDGTRTDFKRHTQIDERVKKIVTRLKKWIVLKDKPETDRRVAFILHNNPCASVEATVGCGAHLDTLESAARILREMKEKGYSIEPEPPEDGKALIANIMARKAVSEFRWTTVDEIVDKGGALALISKTDYEKWFDTLTPEVKERTCEAWGNPPGEEKDGVPAAMVYDNKIVVTGVRYGNAVVCVQPKRGCAGSRCDAQVCKILHDPEVPPPHQYLATYQYLETVFGADVIVHVGTHGNLEFLPGKSVALSESCYPDIAIGNLPHLYIYNSDNPPEGTIAKRRSYATLIDHMQTVMTESGLYGDLKELEDQIAEYNRTKRSDKARAHALEHIIIDLIRKTKLSEEIELDKRLAEEDGSDGGDSFEKVIELAHTAITRIYNTQIPDGMHIFGEVPEGDRKIELINSILRHDSELRRLIFLLLGLDIQPSDAKSETLAEVDSIAKEFIAVFLSEEEQEEEPALKVARRILGDKLKSKEDETTGSLIRIREKVREISARIEASDEMGSLLHGFDAGYIEPGPSGLITRGNPEILPTGRNFYSLDPFKIPTKAAYEIGKRLAEGVIRKYEAENGRIPENVAMYWMCSDIMWADGEQLAQIMHLIGVEPVWNGGRVNRYRIIPLEELGRPRIDVTVRVSGITRDCFYNCIELLDGAIQEVAMLDEPVEKNYLRKHALLALEKNRNGTGTGAETGDGTEFARIFASKPGTYGNGVKLAVYASAWKEEKDLSDVFIHWNGYAYGKKNFGGEAHDSLISQLKTVDLTFNKTVTDEYDLCGCCCYFGTHGGLTTAAREISGDDVSTYYGDTRDQDKIEVRSLADEVRRVVRSKLLNPKWIEGMKRHGYKGAGDISKRIGRVYGWEATTQEVDDWIFDDIARKFVLDTEMREFFEEHNPWALEEVGRRLLEAYERGLWNADEEVIEGLKSAYLEMEGWIEDKMGEVKGDFQGGAIDVMTVEDVEAWKVKMKGIQKE
ncbi:MAG: cobaltochelatase subunit CobN [Methanophagales archaeon]|nr:cobaltochelatase subunit CobN [Methanophagales archaeon]